MCIHVYFHYTFYMYYIKWSSVGGGQSSEHDESRNPWLIRDSGNRIISWLRENYHVCSTRLPYVFMVTIPFGSSVCASMQLFYSRCLTLLNGRFFIRAPPPAHPYGFVGFAHIVYLHYIYAWHIYHIPIFLPASRQHIWIPCGWRDFKQTIDD